MKTGWKTSSFLILQTGIDDEDANLLSVLAKAKNETFVSTIWFSLMCRPLSLGPRF